MEKTENLFDEWNKIKKEIEFFEKSFKRTKIGEIWIGNIGINIGSEISKDGTFQRPFLICTKSVGGDLVGVIPITTKYNKNFDKFLIKIENFKKFGLKYESYLCINQFKFISKKRLVKRINDFNIGKYIQPISQNFIKEFLLKELIKIIE